MNSVSRNYVSKYFVRFNKALQFDSHITWLQQTNISEANSISSFTNVIHLKFSKLPDPNFCFKKCKIT